MVGTKGGGAYWKGVGDGGGEVHKKLEVTDRKHIERGACHMG